MRLLVEGSVPLNGSYQVAGSSNEAITLIAASLLTDQAVTLHRAPQTAAVRQWLGMAQALGTQSTWDGSSIRLQTPRVTGRHISNAETNRMVASILFLAPILAQRQHATLDWSQPLGRLFTHLTALRDLGFRIEVQGNRLNITAQPWEQHDITLMESSVTATALVIMLSAVLGRQTTLRHAASEPQIRALLALLGRWACTLRGPAATCW
ncbi:MAG: hypothetical protein HC915_06850 [Anaerolineae bacterium]|nr:hypothetical protein [Anaerolineae bacterium]